jgi:hypothetical protein
MAKVRISVTETMRYQRELEASESDAKMWAESLQANDSTMSAEGDFPLRPTDVSWWELDTDASDVEVQQADGSWRSLVDTD